MANVKKKEKHTSRKTKVVGTKQFLDTTTNELVDMEVITIEDRDFNFTKIWIGYIVSALESVGNQKIKVVTYLMQNLTKENYIIESQREIAKNCGVSLETVRQTMSALQDADIINMKQRGVYQLNPNCMFKGGHKQRLNVLMQYQATKAENEKKKSKDKFDVIDGGKSGVE